MAVRPHTVRLWTRTAADTAAVLATSGVDLFWTTGTVAALDRSFVGDVTGQDVAEAMSL